MKPKLFSLALIGVLAFTSCQSDVSAEDPQEVIELQNSEKEVIHDVNKWHKPLGEPFESFDDGYRLHEAGYFEGALANCDTYAHYEGGKNLMVLQDAPQSYHGEVEVNKIETNDQLNLCGSVSVNKSVNINFKGILNLGGEMITEGDVKVLYGGHLVIEGNVIIKGDLLLSKDSILKFLGDDSSIEVLGRTNIHKDAIIEGNFKDVSNKIK